MMGSGGETCPSDIKINSEITAIKSLQPVQVSDRLMKQSSETDSNICENLLFNKRCYFKFLNYLKNDIGTIG